MDRILFAVLRWFGRNWVTTIVGVGAIVAYFSPETLRGILRIVLQKLMFAAESLLNIIFGEAAIALNRNPDLLGWIIVLMICIFVLRRMFRSLFTKPQQKK